KTLIVNRGIINTIPQKHVTNSIINILKNNIIVDKNDNDNDTNSIIKTVQINNINEKDNGKITSYTPIKLSNSKNAICNLKFDNQYIVNEIDTTFILSFKNRNISNITDDWFM